MAALHAVEGTRYKYCRNKLHHTATQANLHATNSIHELDYCRSMQLEGTRQMSCPGTKVLDDVMSRFKFRICVFKRERETKKERERERERVRA